MDSDRKEENINTIPNSEINNSVYSHPLSISVSAPIIKPPSPPSVLRPIENSSIGMAMGMDIGTDIDTRPFSVKKIVLPSIQKRPSSVSASISVKPKYKNTLLPPPIKEKRVVTQKKQWTYTENDYSHKTQMELLSNLLNPGKINRLPTSQQIVKEKCMSQEISKKIYGYKSQDLAKKIFDESKFITYEKCIQLLIDSNLTCFYCKNPVQVLYESVREPTQWSIERIDNTFGHNHDNIEIACLKCNVSRRTMYHERYIFTKQLNIIKMDNI
jgi:hypothetical protein